MCVLFLVLCVWPVDVGIDGPSVPWFLEGRDTPADRALFRAQLAAMSWAEFGSLAQLVVGLVHSSRASNDHHGHSPDAREWASSAVSIPSHPCNYAASRDSRC